jgi:hypothetical protein
MKKTITFQGLFSLSLLTHTHNQKRTPKDLGPLFFQRFQLGGPCQHAVITLQVFNVSLPSNVIHHPILPSFFLLLFCSSFLFFLLKLKENTKKKKKLDDGNSTHPAVHHKNKKKELTSP